MATTGSNVRATGIALVAIGIVCLGTASQRQSTLGAVAGAMLVLAGALRLLRLRRGPDDRP